MDSTDSIGPLAWQLQFGLWHQSTDGIGVTKAKIGKGARTRTKTGKKAL